MFFTDESTEYFYDCDASTGPLFSNDSEYLPNETVRSPVVRGERPRPYFPPPPPPPLSTEPSKDFYEEENLSSGPIYEDIDRMCSYRGPPQSFKDKSVKVKDKKKRKSKKSDKELSSGFPPTDANASRGIDVNEITYYNVDNNGMSRAFNEPAGPGPGNVIVNPMTSPAMFHTRLRTMSPATNTRPPLSPYSARMAASTLSSSQSTPTKNGSMYYYSDTLKHKNSSSKKQGLRTVRDLQNGGRVDSDSGISVSRADFPMDDLPSMRQQILMVNPSSPALTSLTSSPSSSPISTSTASPRGAGCTSPSRGCTSPSALVSPRTQNSQKHVMQKYV